MIGYLYDLLMARTERAGLTERRRALLVGAHGRVLEVGAGTGVNLGLYGADVDELVLVEPAEGMASRLRARAAESQFATEVVSASATKLPFADSSFDAVVATLVLCSVSDPARALAELRRVLRPGGVLLFLEHVRSRNPRLARWQDRLTPFQKLVGGGCHPNRDTLGAIERAGFVVAGLERGAVPRAPAYLRPLITGTARAS